jgi:hypothetical protein
MEVTKQKIVLYCIIFIAMAFILFGLSTLSTEEPDQLKVQFTKLSKVESSFLASDNLENFVQYGRSLDSTLIFISNLRDSLQERFYYKLSKEAGKQYNVNWKILYSVWMRESKMDPSAKGDGRKDTNGTFIPGTWAAFGLGQIHVASAKTHYDKNITKERLMNPIENGYASAAILRDYIALSDPVYGIASYQAGPATVQGDFKIKKAPKNWKYVTDVLVLASEVKD